MRVFKITLTALALGIFLAPALGCAAKPSQASPSENQVVTVGRGNLTIDITGSGNLVLSQKEDLAFELAGTVAEVLVAEGDTVEEKQVLAKLDTADWEKQLSDLKDKITAAERQLTAKKRNMTVKEREVVQAELNLKDAQTALDTVQVTYTVADFLAAQAAVDAAKTELDKALQLLSQYEAGTAGYNIKRDLVSSAQSRLKSAQAKSDDMLSGFGKEVASKERQVEAAQWKLEDALIAVEDAQIAIKDAQKALDDARQALAEAQSVHPQIIAPFAGFITKVNVKGGDEVKKGTVAVTLADPNKFEADIMVNETDILQTKLGGNAGVQVEAMPGMSLPAKVTHIAPTAVIQQGVVNYKVKVEIESLQPVMQAQQPAMANLSADNTTSPRQQTGGSPFSGNITAGALPDRMRQAMERGGITQEQIEEMRRQRQGGTQAAQGQIPAVASGDFQLREGQTVTVSILVAERNDVLLVPNGAIARRGTESMVKALKDGVIEERSITTGISNWQYTEVTGGLSEGETVVVPRSTTTTQTTPQQGGQMFFPRAMR